MKNKACCWVLAIFGTLLLLVVAGSGMLVFALMKGASSQQIAVRDKSYLTIELTGRLDEHRTEPRISVLPGRKPTSLKEILQSLEAARTDDRIEGVILKPFGVLGFAGLREIREALKDFRLSGKPVYSYLEVATDRDYYLSSVADTIVMVPSNSGGMVMLGMGVASTYWAGTLEKLGLKFNVLHVGDFKGAFENFGRRRMSDSLRHSLQVLIDDMFRTYVAETVADRGGISYEDLEGELLNGEDYLISGVEAQAKRLVDLVMDWEDLRKRLETSGELNTISVTDYARTTGRTHARKKIAIVFAEGGINYTADPADPLGTDDSIEPESFIRQLRKLREDEDVAAVVVRVNSPGGSALASDLILQEMKRLRTEKPVVVSMGNVAASGGYYISCNADYIFAQPNTVTGSIGVVGVIPTAEGLYKKMDAHVERVEKGKWGQFIRIDQDLTREQEVVLLNLMQGVYRDFVEHVAAGRNMSTSDVEAIASGRVWTGYQAFHHRLVDELGGLQAAVHKAREMAGVSTEEVQLRYYPDEQDLLSFLMRRFGTVLRGFPQNLFLNSDERQMIRMADYVDGFMRRRDFIQMLAPIDANF